MNKTEKILTAGTFISFIGVLSLMFFGHIIIEVVGYSYMVITLLIGLITAFWMLFYAYKGKKLNEVDGLWLLGITIFFVFMLPVFWYVKIYKPITKTT